jgi:D-alanyl-D-alanine dipeptidase
VSELSESDRAWWIGLEERVVADLVDLGERGFLVDHVCWRRGWTDDPRVLLRRSAAEGLERARDALPAGHNLKVFDGWRPWPVQQRCAERAEGQIRAAHPDWPPEQVAAQVWRMAPPARVVPRLASHRYGGAVDVTVVAADGAELEMGVAVNHCTDERSDLLHYHLRDDLSAAEAGYRANRGVLIRAMASGGYGPYLAEFWHWDYRGAF